MRVSNKVNISLSIIFFLCGCGPEKSPVSLVDPNESLVWEKSIDDVRSEQKRIIKEIYKSEEKLRFEYFNDSIIKTVGSLEKGRPFGFKLEFRENGKLYRKVFVGKKGNEIGDETIFDLDGEIQYHFYKNHASNNLFVMEFLNGEVRQIKGKPWCIFIPGVINIGDTAVYSISCPLVPNYTTYVEFGILDDSTSTIRYINDIRQMRIKLHMKKVELVKHKLKVTIKDKDQQVLVEDSTIISTNVVP